MALVNLDGNFLIPIGPNAAAVTLAAPTISAQLLDAANEALIFIGQITTSDGGSHTINTTGSSSLGWRSGAVTFATGTTVVKVGIGTVDSATGPPGRATNVSDVVTFQCSKSLTGGGGGITANTWQTHVPDTGSMTIANGDIIAFSIQMTARGGTDAINPGIAAGSAGVHRPLVTQFTGGAYALTSGVPNAIITFADGALGFFAGSEVCSAITTRSWNSTGATKEYGQLFDLPFPTKVYGIFGWVLPNADFDVVLYSSPLGTPVAEKTLSFHLNVVASSTGRRFTAQFSSPYSTTAGQEIVVAFKPGTASITAYFKTIANAAHRIADPWGTTGYGVSRTTGAFADANASLEHYYLGLLVGAFDAGGGAAAGRAVQINNDSLVS